MKTAYSCSKFPSLANIKTGRSFYGESEGLELFIGNLIHVYQSLKIISEIERLQERRSADFEEIIESCGGGISKLMDVRYIPSGSAKIGHRV